MQPAQFGGQMWPCSHFIICLNKIMKLRLEEGADPRTALTREEQSALPPAPPARIHLAWVRPPSHPPAARGSTDPAPGFCHSYGKRYLIGQGRGGWPAWAGARKERAGSKTPEGVVRPTYHRPGGLQGLPEVKTISGGPLVPKGSSVPSKETAACLAWGRPSWGFRGAS